MITLPDTVLAAFISLDVVLGGSAAWMTGRVLASEWRSAWLVVIYMALLAAAVRFMHFAVGGGKLLSAPGIMMDFAVLVTLALLSFRVTRAAQMARQYPWRYRRTSPITWASRAD